jgi:hypothetical protein
VPAAGIRASSPVRGCTEGTGLRWY